MFSVCLLQGFHFLSFYFKNQLNHFHSEAQTSANNCTSNLASVIKTNFKVYFQNQCFTSLNCRLMIHFTRFKWKSPFCSYLRSQNGMAKSAWHCAYKAIGVILETITSREKKGFVKKSELQSLLKSAWMWISFECGYRYTITQYAVIWHRMVCALEHGLKFNRKIKNRFRQSSPPVAVRWPWRLQLRCKYSVVASPPEPSCNP